MRARAIVLGLALVPLNVYWVIVAELRWYVILTLNPLFITPVFYLAVLSLVNAGLKRHAPRAAFTGAELIVIYIMLVMSCTIATHDFIINLMTNLVWPAWQDTPGSNVRTTLFPHLPQWMFVWDRDLLEGAFKGNSNLYRLQVLRMFAAPLALWSVFILSVGWIMLCLNVIVRKAWVEHTRLSFPIVRLPLVLTDGGGAGATLRSRLFWLGVALAAVINLTNGLHEYFPSLPAFPTRAQSLPMPFPNNQISGSCYMTYYPFAIGLAFLVPLDVSFSCWFFYLFMKVQLYLGSLYGYLETPEWPYVSEQAIGAWLAFAGYLIYSMRGYLRGVFRAALRGASDEDSGEPMSYRAALIGLVLGMAVFFGFWWAAGMSPLWVGVVLATYILLALCITRVRAEAGGQHTVWDLEPMRMFRLFDARLFGPSTIAMAGMSHWYWRLNRSHVMPSQLEAFKLAQEHGIRLRSLVWPMMAAFALATVCGMWACLHVFYGAGATAKCIGFANWTGAESFGFIQTSLASPFKFEPGRWVAVGGSAGLIVVLSALRSRFAGFPLHPLGYCIGPGLLWLWEPFLIAWLVKLLILRYGGLKTYRAAMPFFLGLVLGDYLSGALWSLVGVVWDIPVYQTFH